MTSDTFHSRILSVLQKSRRALRLYTQGNAGKLTSQEEFQAELSSLQISEWREVNNFLVRKLSQAAEGPSAKRLVFEIFSVRTELAAEYKAAEEGMGTAQRELNSSVENNDFARSAILARSLVTLKARKQAYHAAHHEVDLIIRRSKITNCPDEREVNQTIELLEHQVVGNEELGTGYTPAKVIPLRRVR